MTPDVKPRLVPSARFGGVDELVPLLQWPADQPLTALHTKTLRPVVLDQAIGAVVAPGMVIAYERDGLFWVVGGIAVWSHLQNLVRELGHPRIRISTLVLACAPVEYGQDWLKRELALASAAPSTSTAVLTALLMVEHPLVYPQEHRVIAETFGVSISTSEKLRRIVVRKQAPYRSRPVRTAAAPARAPRGAPPDPASSARPTSGPAIAPVCDPGSTADGAAAPFPSVSPPPNKDESTCPTEPPKPSQLSLL